MSSYYAYAFLTGIYIGGYTNLFSKVVISGLVLYIVHPDNFNPRRFNPLYKQIYDHTYPYISKVYTFAETNAYSFAKTNSETNSETNYTTSPLPPLKSPILNIIEKSSSK